MVSAQAQHELKNGDAEVELTVPLSQPRPVLIIVMGPASCGKSTIGHDLSLSLSLPFIDGDTLHPASNIEKMSRGIPLTDDDRLPWLALIRSTAERVCKSQHENDHVREEHTGGLGRSGVVIACSALKKWYRDILRGEVGAMPPEISDLPPSHPDARPSQSVHRPATSNLLTLFLYCHGTPTVLAARIAARKGHFMGAKMLESQLATLEDPRHEAGVTSVAIDQREEDVARDASANLRRLVKEVVVPVD